MTRELPRTGTGAGQKRTEFECARLDCVAFVQYAIRSRGAERQGARGCRVPSPPAALCVGVPSARARGRIGGCDWPGHAARAIAVARRG